MQILNAKNLTILNKLFFCCILHPLFSRSMSQHVSGASFFGDCRSSWEMIPLHAGRTGQGKHTGRSGGFATLSSREERKTAAQLLWCGQFNLVSACKLTLATTF